MAETIADRRRRLARSPLVSAPASGEFAAVLSALLPGLGQWYRGQWTRGAVLLGLPVAILVVVGALAVGVDAWSGALIRNADAIVAVALGAGCLVHLSAVGDAFNGERGLPGLVGRRRREYAVLITLLVALLAGYGAVYQRAAAWAGLTTRLFTPVALGSRAATTATPPPAWTGTERLNVLLLGIDSRGPTDTDRNTDTMIILTLDPLNRTVGMLSIPRDIFIDRPGIFQEKLNAAYSFGGADLSRRLIEDLLRIDLNAYGLLDFDAFTRIIDGAGGILVDVRRPLRDETYPTAAFGVQRLDILAGPQLMRGEAALRYARTRHGSTDYDRAARQQEVVAALRARLTGGDILVRLPAIMNQVGPAIQTSFDPAQVLPVARLGAGIDRGAIRTEVLYPCGGDFSHCELREQNGPGGFYLFPDRARIADLVAQVFYDPRVRQEAALIEVRGGGERREALLAVAGRLAARAYNVSATSTEGPAAARTVVYLRNQAKRATADALAAQLGLRAAVPLPPGDASAADIIAVIGADYRGLTGDAGR